MITISEPRPHREAHMVLSLQRPNTGMLLARCGSTALSQKIVSRLT